VLPRHPTIKLLLENGWRHPVDGVHLDAIVVLGSGQAEVERFQAATVAGSEVRMKARSIRSSAYRRVTRYVATIASCLEGTVLLYMMAMITDHKVDPSPSPSPPFLSLS
jgi:hypothetical protein